MAEYVEYEATPGPKMWRFGKFSFSSMEFQHLGVALVMITLTLMVFNRSGLQQLGIVNFIVLNILTIGLGFLLHEFAHKLVAQNYGFISEFRADFMMLFFALLLALVSPVIFLAPGAVLIHGRVTTKQNGIISVAGPLVNLTLAIIFLLVGLILQPTGALLSTLVWLGIWVNSFLGVFNMIPVWVLDGKKVLAWNKGVYAATMGALLVMLVFGTSLV